MSKPKIVSTTNIEEFVPEGSTDFLEEEEEDDDDNEEEEDRYGSNVPVCHGGRGFVMSLNFITKFHKLREPSVCKQWSIFERENTLNIIQWI